MMSYSRRTYRHRIVELSGIEEPVLFLLFHTPVPAFERSLCYVVKKTHARMHRARETEVVNPNYV